MRPAVGRFSLFGLAAMALGLVASGAQAEISEVAVAQTYGTGYLPLMVMERNRLVEKAVEAAGLPAPKMVWQTVSGPSVMNEGLVSGALHFAATGSPSLITLWSKTRGSNAVRGVAAMTSYQMYLNVRNPEVKSIRDFSPADKIVVPSVKVSTQAMTLQMAAAQAFGPAEYARLDPFTVSLSHPDGMIALLNNTAGVNAHFASSPYHEQEIRTPGVRTLFTSYDVMGGQASALLITTATRFREENPKTYRAFLKALGDAIETVNKDKEAAGRLYLDMTHEKTPLAEIVQIISSPGYEFTLTPQKVFKTASFMFDIGTIKQKPEGWKEMFFPEIYDQPGD